LIKLGNMSDAAHAVPTATNGDGTLAVHIPLVLTF